MRKRKTGPTGTPTTLKVGDSVVVNDGIKDPDLGSAIGGWQGRIVRVESDRESGQLVHIQWDSVTLRGMPGSALTVCERDGLDWREMVLAVGEVHPATARDTPSDVARAVADLLSRYAWTGLGPEGERIQEVLMGIAPGDERKAMRAWHKHLAQRLRFPFEAKVAEYQERGPLQSGDRVIVGSIFDADEHYGVLVAVRRGTSRFDFPLCDLAVLDERSPNYDMVHDYAVWFANR